MEAASAALWTIMDADCGCWMAVIWSTCERSVQIRRETRRGDRGCGVCNSVELL